MICVIEFICVDTPKEITGRWRCLYCYAPYYPLRQGPSLNPELVWHSSWLQHIPPIVGVTDVPCHARDFYVGVWDPNSHPCVCAASVLTQGVICHSVLWVFFTKTHFYILLIIFYLYKFTDIYTVVHMINLCNLVVFIVM